MSRLLPGNLFPQVAESLFSQHVTLDDFFPQVRGDLFPRRLLTVAVQPQSVPILYGLLESRPRMTVLPFGGNRFFFLGCCPLDMHPCPGPLDLFEW